MNDRLLLIIVLLLSIIFLMMTFMTLSDCCTQTTINNFYEMTHVENLNGNGNALGDNNSINSTKS